MDVLDYVIFTVYMVAVLCIGFYHFKKNSSSEDYYVAGRGIPAHHVGLSVVATDVGGGFSIGLGGLGFTMGLSGSWLLFSGLIGAWLSAVFIIPKIKKLDKHHKMFTYPDFLRYHYGNKVALVAAVITSIGYLGFSGAQILAGAKLASGTLFPNEILGLSPFMFSLLTIAVITILYTAIGGLKAVIYTDTFQWIILLSGLLFITFPITIIKLGGFSVLFKELPAQFWSLSNISFITFFNWMITIIPIWLVGMTIYQRFFACRDEKEAKKAWYIAGFFEYPVMAFIGVLLGMCARVLFPLAEPEMGVPLLIRDILPVGVGGIVIASYFSAIMSTADSCLMASSGSLLNDIISKYFIKDISGKNLVRLSQIVTLIIGVIAFLIASMFQTVLDAILYAYSFLVSGLF
ncbi:MAG: sodium:solute symporter family protein, partial [Endomicrobiaceae bacterium]